MQTSNRIKYNYEIFFCFQPCVRRGKRLLSGFFFMRTFLENAQFHNNWLVLIQTNNWVQFIRQFSNKLLISFNLDLWKIMKLSFLLLLCILISFQSVRSPSFDIKFHGLQSIPIVSFVEHLFAKTFVIQVLKPQNCIQLWSLWNNQSSSYYKQRSAHGTWQHK